MAHNEALTVDIHGDCKSRVRPKFDKSKLGHRHEHSGRSSEEYLSGHEIVKIAGIKDGDTVVDAGSSSGHVSIAASDVVGMDGLIIAIDLHEEAIEKLNSRIDSEGLVNIKAINGSFLTDMPIPGTSVDVFLMVKVLHGTFINEEVKQLKGILDEYLKETGKVVIVEKDDRWDDLDPNRHTGAKVHSAKDVMSLIGLKLIGSQRLGEDHNIGVFTRN